LKWQIIRQPTAQGVLAGAKKETEYNRRKTQGPEQDQDNTNKTPWDYILQHAARQQKPA
jgi:hypothetical protein